MTIPSIYRCALLMLLLLLATGFASSSARAIAFEDESKDAVSGEDTSHEDPFVGLCEAAIASFTPPTEAERRAELAKVKQAAKDLAGYLDRAEDQENADAWRAYLELETLEEAMAEAARDVEATGEEALPEFKPLRSVFLKLAGGEEGLQLEPFRNLRNALRRYLMMHQAAEKPETFVQQGETMLEDLVEKLTKYETAPTATDAAHIGRIMNWLADHNKAEDLRQAVHASFSHPNIMIDVSSRFATSGMHREVKNEPTEVTDVILGTTIHGEGTTDATTTARLVPSESQGKIKIEIESEIETETLGVNGPARIRSTNCTTIKGSKTIVIDADGLRSEPTVSRADTCTTIQSVSVTRGPLVETIARNRVRRDHAEAERISARHAETRFNRRVDDEATDSLSRLNSGYQERVFTPLQQQGLFPSLLNIRSTADTLKIVATETMLHRLAAPTTAPQCPQEGDLAIRLHESALNNIAFARLSGTVVDNEGLAAEQRRWQETFAKKAAPSESAKSEDETPWSITFTREMPITTEIKDGTARLTIRGSGFEEDGTKHDGMAISVAYRLESYTMPEAPKAQRFRLVLQDDPDVLPLDHLPGSDERLSAREIATQVAIQARLDLAVPETIDIPAHIGLPKPWGKIDGLELTSCELQDGWLLLCWKARDVAPEAAKPAADKQTAAE